MGDNAWIFANLKDNSNASLVPTHYHNFYPHSQTIFKNFLMLTLQNFHHLKVTISDWLDDLKLRQPLTG